jgi:hypothetical protein
MITPSFALTATERVLPKMALDFTTASLDPRVTFTRSGNTATVVNSSGYIAPINADLPRFDYDPTTLICKGLLIEESRTNSALRSEDFNVSPWLKGNATVTGSALTAPDNNLTANKLVEDATTNTHLVVQSILYTSGTAYTCSIFAKAGERTFIQLRVNASSQFSASFDLVNGTASQASAGTTAAIRSAGNGWFRCSITFTATATAAGSSRIGLMLNATTQSYAGDGTSGAYIWGGQLEAGAFATSYIPTTLLTVTRNADVATMTGTNFSDWFNASEGAVVAEFTPQAAISTASTAQLLYEIGDGSSSNRFRAFRNNDDGKMFLSNNAAGSANVSAIGGVVSATGVKIKTAAAYKLDNFGIATSGNAAATDTSAAVCTADQMRIGRGFNNANYLNGIFAKLFYYPQRLTNAEIQAFSK